MRQKNSNVPSKRTSESNDFVYVELDTKCNSTISFNFSSTNNHSHQHSIQFSRRYLQCQSSMPISILRSFIQLILPHSSTTQVYIYDSNDRLLDDSRLLGSLITEANRSSTSKHIPIRFTLINTITSIPHCSCLASFETHSTPTNSSSTCSMPNVIQRDSLAQTLSTCTFMAGRSSIPSSRSSLSSSMSSSSSSSSSKRKTTTMNKSQTMLSPSSSFSSSSPLLNDRVNPISIVNLLSPPVSSSSSSSSPSFRVDSGMIDEITANFGEICPPARKKRRNGKEKVSKMTEDVLNDCPLDLTMKNRTLPQSCNSQILRSKPIEV